MEDVLEVYARPYDSEYPVVCMDEKPLQLLTESRRGRKSKNSGISYEDSEYIRNGTCSIFLFTEPLSGWRHADAQEQRTKVDWAKQTAWLLMEQYPEAGKVILVCDNLNTHNISSFYEAFPPEKAFEPAQRIEIHHTPKHGSRLYIAEIELSALSKQCLGTRQIDNIEELNKEISKWEVDRNNKQKGVDWQFTAKDARVKLKSFYPLCNF